MKDWLVKHFRVIVILLGCTISLVLFIPGILSQIADSLGLTETKELMLKYSEIVFIHYVFDFLWLFNLFALIACIKWKKKWYVKLTVIILNIPPFTAILFALPLLLP